MCGLFREIWRGVVAHAALFLWMGEEVGAQVGATPELGVESITSYNESLAKSSGRTSRFLLF